MAHGNKGFIIPPMWVIAFVALWQYMGLDDDAFIWLRFRDCQGPL